MIPSVAVLVALVAVATAYPQGAPQDPCPAFIANHENHLPQSGGSNYIITTSAPSVASGGSLTVTIAGQQGEKFKGFFVQALDSRTKKAVGTFSISSSASQTRNCVGPNDAVTHTSSSLKDKVELKWTAPANFKGTLKLRAVIVKSFEVFWNNVYSSPVTVV